MPVTGPTGRPGPAEGPRSIFYDEVKIEPVQLIGAGPLVGTVTIDGIVCGPVSMYDREAKRSRRVWMGDGRYFDDTLSAHEARAILDAQVAAALTERGIQ